MTLMIGLITAGFSAAVEEGGSQLDRVSAALEACRADIPAMTPLAEDAADRLAAGGHLYAGGQSSMVSELTGRAGGFMMIRPLGEGPPERKDVVIYTPEPGGSVPEVLNDTKAFVVLLGSAFEGQEWPVLPNHAAETGISPTLANAIPGWVFTGELVAALTRLGRMPVIYESIGAYGGMARIDTFENGRIAWHDDLEVPPVQAGVLANRYIDCIQGLLARVEREERSALDRAGVWAAQAARSKSQLFMYSMGHLFPDEVEKTAIGELFRSGVWNAGFRQHPVPDHAYEKGDTLIHIGYQQPPLRLLDRACPVSARVVYVSVRPHRDYVNIPETIWIDPMWPWADAVVPLEGYDIPLLPASGIVNGAIAWEIYRVTREALNKKP